MSNKLVLFFTLLGFPIVYYIPEGRWIVPAFWALYGVFGIVYEWYIVKYFKEEYDESKEQDYILIESLLVQIFPDDNHAILWMLQYESNLNGIPAELIQTKSGRTAVKNFLVCSLVYLTRERQEK